MMNAKPILDHYLTEEDYFLLGQAVVNAYKGCDLLVNDSPMFEKFAVGREFRSRLLGLAVEYELDRLSMETNEFYAEIKPNRAHNCHHVRLNKGRLALTSHFMGRRAESLRSKARVAKNREVLAGRNFELFEINNSDAELVEETGHVYCQLLHGGIVTPELSILALPTHDQKGIRGNCSLPIPDPEIAKVEEISDEIVLKLQKQTIEIEGNQSGQDSWTFPGEEVDSSQAS